jgi:hypothetical protein
LTSCSKMLSAQRAAVASVRSACAAMRRVRPGSVARDVGAGGKRTSSCF